MIRARQRGPLGYTHRMNDETSIHAGSPADAQLKESLKHIVRTNDHLLSLLMLVRDEGLPDAWVAAGAIRSAAWDHIFEARTSIPRADVDVVYFDPSRARPEHDRDIEQRLHERAPATQWEVVNQARVHEWPENQARGMTPLRSATDGIATWNETATCVGARCLNDGTIEITAPLGLGDLFAGKIRRNPISCPRVYERRLREKRWQDHWPKLKAYRASDLET